MSILVDRDILAAISDGEIVIEPFDRNQLGTNSYDVRLAPTLKTYVRGLTLDCQKDNITNSIEIPEEGYVLQPGVLYLASTIEYTRTHVHVPVLSGRSSLGRLGLSIHVTAGFGDQNYSGHWTMEMFVIHPLRIYAGIRVAQLVYYTASGKADVPYDKKQGAKYNNRDPHPQASKIHEDGHG